MFNIISYSFDFNYNNVNFSKFNYFLLKLFLNFWFFNYNSKFGLLILEVLHYSTKLDIIYAVKLIFGINRILSVNTLVKKKYKKHKGYFKKKLTKKAFVKFLRI